MTITQNPTQTTTITTTYEFTVSAGNSDMVFDHLNSNPDVTVTRRQFLLFDRFTVTGTPANVNLVKVWLMLTNLDHHMTAA